MFTVAQKDIAVEGQEICTFKSTSEFLITAHISLLREELLRAAAPLEKCRRARVTLTQHRARGAHPPSSECPSLCSPCPALGHVPTLHKPSCTLGTDRALRQSVRFSLSGGDHNNPRFPARARGARAAGLGLEEAAGLSTGCPNLRSWLHQKAEGE